MKRIQCCTPGCRGPAWEIEGLGWYCECDCCTLTTIRVGERQKNLAYWYGEQLELDLVVVNDEKPVMRVLDICPGLPEHHNLHGKDCFKVSIINLTPNSWNRMYADWNDSTPEEFFDAFPQNTVYLWLEQAL